MVMDILIYIFNICIIIGFVIPLLNLVTGWFGGFFDAGADVDVPSLDAGGSGADVSAGADVGAGADTSIGNSALIPFNIMCLCLFLVVFGALGHIAKLFMTSSLTIVLLLVACVCVAALSYWGLYVLLIKRLKNSDSTTMTLCDLHGERAEVTLRITKDSNGMISVKDNIGAPISFRAMMDPELKSQMPDILSQGESVIITEIDRENNLCYVSVPVKKFNK